MFNSISKYFQHLFLSSLSIVVITLLSPVIVYANTGNFYTSCIKTANNTLYNVALGTSPSAACSAGDTQVSADYGDLQSITAGAGLTGGGTQGDITLSISDSGITTAKIADLAVSTAKIAANAITEAKLAIGAVTESVIADLAVTTAKIADLAVTTAKIASGAITTPKLADNAVTFDKLSTDMQSGWLPANETWTYNSASAFTVSGDQTAKYSKGTRLKFTQTTIKYGVVISSSYSSPNTTVTILTNTDYTIANATISSNSYSYASNPQGYPDWFATAAPSGWMGVDDGSGGAPTVVSFRQKVDGHTLKGRIFVGSSYKAGTWNEFRFLSPIYPIDTHDFEAIGSGIVRTQAGSEYSATSFYYQHYIYMGVASSIDDNTQLNSVSWDYSFEI